MALFENYFVVLELKHLPLKEKRNLKLSITENGGSISYVVNKQCSLIVTSSFSSLSSSRLRNRKKYNTPVVGVDYVSHCLEKRVLLPVERYNLVPSPSPSVFTPGPATSSEQVLKVTKRPLREPSNIQTHSLHAVNQSRREENCTKTGIYLGKFRIYTENDNNLPAYPPNFEVAKYSIFEKAKSRTISVLELHSCKGEGSWQYRVVRCWTDDFGNKSSAVRDQLVFCTTSEEAIEIYQTIRKELCAKGLKLKSSLPAEAQELGSTSLQQMLLEENRNCMDLSQEVGVFVELLWTEALGCLDNTLKIPVTSISLNDVSRAEGLLLHVQRKLKEDGTETDVASLMEEVYTLLPHRQPCPAINTWLVSQKLDLCQLLRDVLNVSEVSLRDPVPSCLGKYRALRCGIERVPPGSPEFESVSSLLQDRKVQILQLLHVSRGVELKMFKKELGNVKSLLHSSNPSSFVGILSRGMMLPRDGVEHHGVQRTDIGNLGGGIYFSNNMSTSVKYSKPSVTDGSRLLLVCDVALGDCQDFWKKDTSLSHAPKGYQSVHGVRNTSRTPSEFEDDEFVVYSPEQVKLKYVVQYRLEEDKVKEFQPDIDTSSELPLLSSPSDLLSGSEEDGIGSCNNPLDSVTAGLLDNTGQPIPLQAIHVKSKLLDLLSEVIIFQKYTNQSSVPIEAKYVFPLDDSAAVCGFEAFINGKHVVGKVKEKEQARKDYKQAIEKGHGAYLMDQDAPDVFTISVGNLPPHATILIKVTFVTELVIKSGSVVFSLPGRVAPWQENAALNQMTQVTVEKVCVAEMETQGEFSLDMSIEMPYEIIKLQCITHEVQIKRTDCKAVVRTLTGQSLGSDGFQLTFGLSQVHLPRMWVENHPDKDTQACMLVFYPEFDSYSSSGSDEVVLLLDTSESMKGEALQNARRIALQVLKSLDPAVKVNIISFGKDHVEAFFTAQPLTEVLQEAKLFISSSPPIGGNTDLWRPLRSLSLLPPSRGIRNLLLLSDGHVQNQSLPLQLLREQAPHTRLFTCGLSSTANRHMLRALAQAGGGANEFFDTKTKHNWTEKVVLQVKRMASAGCSSVSVKWQQFNASASPLVQAPTQLSALFSDCHTLVYGFVQHCTQATLLGDLSGEEIKTMVSTTELQMTRGTLLHKLTARAVIRDFENGSLHANEAEHEGRKAELKSFVIGLSKEFSILSQFTSFVAIEERDSEQPEDGFTDVPKLIAEENVDILPYLTWMEGGGTEIRGEDNSTEQLLTYEEDDDAELCSPSTPILFNSQSIEADSSPIEFAEVLFEQSFTPETLNIECRSGAVQNIYAIKRRKRRDAPTFNTDSFPSTQSLGSCVSRNSALILAPADHPRPPALALALDPLAKLQMMDCTQHTLIGSRPSLSLPSASASYLKYAKCQPSYIFHGPAPTCPPPPPPPVLSQPTPPPPPPPPLSVEHCPPLRESSFKTVETFETKAQSLHFSPCVPAARCSKKYRPTQSSSFSRASVEGWRSLPECMGMEQVPPPTTTPSPEPGIVFHARSRAAADRPPGASQQGPGGLFSGSEQSVRMADRLPPSIISPEKSHCPPTLFGSVGTVHITADSIGSLGGLMFGNSSTNKAFPGPGFGAMETSFCFASPSVKHSEKESSHELSSVKLQNCSVKLGRPKPQLRISPPSLQPLSSLRKSVIATVDWPEVFNIQHSEGYWECSVRLGTLLDFDMDFFANTFLKNRGICSLGVRAHADILKLVATLLVLQLMRVKGLEEGELLRTLFCLGNSPQPRSERWEAVRKAVDWVCWADKQYPCVCSRLEFGFDWESSTRKLLGIDPPYPTSIFMVQVGGGTVLAN